MFRLRSSYFEYLSKAFFHACKCDEGISALLFRFMDLTFIILHSVTDGVV
jgi:hypothetical protein